MTYFKTNNNMKTLYDSREGKETDWKGKKVRSVLMARHLYLADPKFRKKADRMAKCASFLTFKLTDVGLKLNQCYFCKGRLCPMCAWRRSMKIAFQNKRIVEEANKRYKLKWLFLTLTIKNCKGEELREKIDQMMKAWNRLVGYKYFKSSIRGYFRALEVTKNRKFGSKSFGTYHPHFHVLLAVPPSYFGKNYINHSEWVEMWERALRINYSPVIHVQRVKPKKDVDFKKIEDDVKKSIKEHNAILEISKYPVKDSDILTSDKVTREGIETVLNLERGLSRKRLISYGGIMKELHKELNLDDAEDGDLIHTGEDETANAIGEVMAYWHIGLKDYVIHQEVEYINGKRIDKETGEILGDIE